MKKMIYQAPQMEAIDLKLEGVLCASGEEAGGGGTGFAPEMEDVEE